MVEKRGSHTEPQSRRGKIENFAVTHHPTLKAEFRDIAINTIIKVLDTPRERLGDLAYEADQEVAWNLNPYGMDMIRGDDPDQISGSLQHVLANEQASKHPTFTYKKLQEVFTKRIALIEIVGKLEDPSSYKEDTDFKAVSKFLDDVCSPGMNPPK